MFTLWTIKIHDNIYTKPSEGRNIFLNGNRILDFWEEGEVDLEFGVEREFEIFTYGTKHFYKN